MFRAFHCNQHDHENEKHQNPPDVHNDLNAGQKLRMKRQENSRDSEKSGAEERRAMHDVTTRDDQNRGNHRDRGKNIKEDKLQHCSYSSEPQESTKHTKKGLL